MAPIGRWRPRINGSAKIVGPCESGIVALSRKIQFHLGFGNRYVDMTGLGKVVLCWVGTPVGGAIMAVVVYRALAAVNNRMRPNLLESDALLRIGVQLQ